MKIKVIGGGLAGCEAAWFLARHGLQAELYDIKPAKFTPAHSNPDFAELVCSNSLKGKDPYSNACGLLKEEMRILGSLTMEAAAQTEVPAGGALAVDREKFARYITQKITSEKNITVHCEEVQTVQKEWCIVATGPLTCDPLSRSISDICGGQLHFYDASAPIVSQSSLDMEKCFFKDRYEKGGDDYINCPLSKEEYDHFVDELLAARKAELHEFDKREIFEGCMPVEVMAARGRESLRFAMLKPVGLKDGGGNSYYAVLQLRRENATGDAYNLVGFQTNLKFSEQKRVFSIIPALKSAEFLRYGVMHRNTYLNSPDCLNSDFSHKNHPTLFFAGQITGVEGYVESASTGILAAIHMLEKSEGKTPLIPDDATVSGALSAHISRATDNFQPMNANFGILRPPEKTIRDKKARYAYLACRAIENITKYKQSLGL